jgi:O-antigen/teichoic acid export membrane protein
VLAVAVAYVVSDLVLIGWLLRVVILKVGLRGPVAWSSWVGLVRGGAPFLVWETALLTYARIDVVILSIFAHDAVLGWYAAAYRIISLPLFLPSVIMTAVFPALSAASRDEHSFNTIARRALEVTALTTVPMAFGLVLVATALIRFFGYPEGFKDAVPPVTILAIALPLVGINMIVGSVLAARDRQRHWAIAGVVAAIFNVTLNFAAIPYTQQEFGNGAIGAAAVTSLTEVLLLCAGLILVPGGVFGRSTLHVILRCVAAGVVMGAALWPVRDASVLATIPLGAAAYFAAAVALRVVSKADLMQLRDLLSRPRAMTAAETLAVAPAGPPR